MVHNEAIHGGKNICAVMKANSREKVYDVLTRNQICKEWFTKLLLLSKRK